MVGLIFFLFFHRMFLLAKQRKLNRKEMQQRFGSLYQNVDYHKPFALNYTSLFLIRRLSYAAVIVLLGSYGVFFQVNVISAISMLMLLFFFMNLPMIDVKHNFIQIFNEISFIFSLYCMYTFTNYVVDPADQYTWGQIMLRLIAVQTAVNFFILIFDVLRYIARTIKRKYIRRIILSKQSTQLKQYRQFLREGKRGDSSSGDSASRGEEHV